MKGHVYHLHSLFKGYSTQYKEGSVYITQSQPIYQEITQRQRDNATTGLRERNKEKEVYNIIKQLGISNERMNYKKLFTQ
jgi:hypothetical protein